MPGETATSALVAGCVSVSAWMTAAARRALLVRDALAAVAGWEEVHGAFRQAELDVARRRVAEELAAPSRSA
jgi:hypothetical protein